MVCRNLRLFVVEGSLRLPSCLYACKLDSGEAEFIHVACNADAEDELCNPREEDDDDNV